MPAGVLTRIRNNQVYNSDIYADAKVVAKSVSGGLLSDNFTYTGNMTIGNLTVNGNTTTIDTTNLVIADPLFSINRNASGAPSYDLGMVMGRGSSTNVAFIWEEGAGQFQLQYTTQSTAATTFGVINNSGYANLQAYGIALNNATIGSASITTLNTSSTITSSGNIWAASGTSSTNTTTGALVVTGGTGISGALNVGTGINLLGNGYITTDQSSANLLGTATTISAFASGTSITIGSTSGADLIINPTTVRGASSTTSLYNTVATTMNFAGAATTLNMGATSGTANIANPTVIGSQSTQNLYNTVATTMNFAGAATSLNMGAATGAATINNPSLILPNTTQILVNGSNPVIDTSSTGTASVFNANATTVNVGGAATTMNLGKSGAGSVQINTTGNSYGSGQGALQIGGGFYAGGDSYINGNLVVNYINSIGYNAVIANAPLLYLAANSVVSYNYDIGFYSHKYDLVQGYNHTGLVRNHLDNSWFLFSNIRTEPDSTVDLGNVNIIYDTLKLGNLITYSGNAATSTSTGSLVVNGGAGISGAAIVGGIVYANSGTSSTSTTTGAMVVSGGVGVSGNVYLGSNVFAGTLSYTDNNIKFMGQQNYNGYVQSILQNTNNGTAASADFIVNNDQSTASTYYGDFGINSSGFSGSGSLAAPNNVYLTATSSDLVLGTTTSNAIRFVINSGATDSLIIDTNGNVVVQNTTTSTSSTTGAFVVQGGAGIVGNLYVGGNINGTSAKNVPTIYVSNIYPYANSGNINLYTQLNTNLTINSNQIVANLVVHGNSAAGWTNLLTTNGANGSVGIKTAPGQITPNASLMITATDSMIIPVGTTAQRPPNGTSGMVRFNNQSNNLEFYNPSTNDWTGTGSVFTIISDDQFTGDGTTTAFTLSQGGTTNSTLVFINGVAQLPLTAYSVSGTTLTFTEAPLSTDIIDARVTTTTSIATSLSAGSTAFEVTDSGGSTGNIHGYVNGTEYRWIANAGVGGSNYLGNGLSTLASNVTCSASVPTVIDAFSTNAFRGAKYVVSVQDYNNYNFQLAEVIMVIGNGNASIQTYGVVTSGGSSFCNFYANVSGTTARLYANSSVSSVAKVQQIYMPK